MTRTPGARGRPSTRLLLALALAVAGICIFSASAFADTCTLTRTSATVPGNALFDSGGYFFDTDGAQATPSRDAAFGALDDGGSNGPAANPPGPVENDDSWDSLGGLFVGGDALTNLYTSTDDNSCSLEAGGRQLAFPVVNINGLDVQRKLFVSPSGLPGGRLLEIVHNPTATPVTTSVQLGDTQAGNNQDDLGSDNTTVTDFSSSGDTTLNSSDLWGVTTDHTVGTLDDDALAHVFDGAGGADRVDFVSLTGTVPTDTFDNLAYRWDNVAIPPGGTAAFLSYEIQQADATLDAVTDAGLARAQAVAYEAVPYAQVYSGMSDAEIAAVRNWPHPPAVAAIAAVTGATDRTAVTLSNAGSAASVVPGICQTATSSWNFGDGTTGSGGSVSHRFRAGTYNVTLTVANDCGGVATATRSVVVKDKTAPRVSAALAKRIKFSKLAGGKLVLTLRSSEAARASIVGKISRSLAKQASAARISRTVIHKSASLKANKKTKVRLKLSKKARNGLNAVHRSFKLSITVTTKDSAGNKKVTHKTVKVGF
jgi:hypothetical protein